MKISYQWICQLVPGLNLGPADLAERLTMAGLEIEGIDDPTRHWGRVVVGRVLKKERHPDADKLSVCQVEVAPGETRQIICGAPNVAEGQSVPVALEGAELAGGLEIKKAKIRGTESMGMICSEAELGLSEKSDGILVLAGEQAKAKPGTPLKEVLPVEPVLDLKVTPNRGDCLSAIGLAREVAALTERKLQEPKFSLKEAAPAADSLAKVKVEAPDLCPRYCARVIEGLTVKPSPDWLAQTLEAHGVRPINNLVDVTNYILLLHGQPLHAFDLDHVAGQQIIVRKARAGEQITTLDGTERTLDEGMLLIADAQGGVAVAGVMGGVSSEVRDSTTRVLLESAYFEPGQVRRTSRALGLASESSYRFERGVDPSRVPLAMDHAAALLAELGGGTVRKGHIDISTRKFEPLALELRPAKVNASLGLAVSPMRIREHLERLGFTLEGKGSPSFKVKVPTYRSDVTLEADLIEEIARIEGYEKIPETLPLVPSAGAARDMPRTLRETMEDTLASRGWRQSVHLSFISAGWPDWMELPLDDPRRKPVVIGNPINEEQGVLRTALLPTLLETYARTRNRGVRSVRLFETGRVFHPSSGELPVEPLHLALVRGEVDEPGLWRATDPARAALFEVKGDLIALAARIGVAMNLEGNTEEPFLHPGRRAAIIIGSKTVGAWGELAPAVAEHLGVRERLVVAELALEPLIHAALRREHSYTPYGRFPSVWRDLALLVGEDISASELTAEACEAGKPLAQYAEIFDEFRGKGMEPGKRSLGLRICYGAPDRTLTEEEASSAEARVLQVLAGRFGASKRA